MGRAQRIADLAARVSERVPEPGGPPVADLGLDDEQLSVLAEFMALAPVAEQGDLHVADLALRVHRMLPADSWRQPVHLRPAGLAPGQTPGLTSSQLR